MTLEEIVSAYWKEGIWALIAISGIIQISPLKLNPWSWVAKKIGNEMNWDLIKRFDKLEERVESLDKKLDSHISWNDENSAIEKRIRILRFADDIQNGIARSQQHYEQILGDITDYNNYCENHPTFKNKVTVHSAELIEDAYDEHLRNHDFL